MSSTYSSSLRVELIGSGDQAGAWGATTDNSFAYVFDTAIAGYQAVPITSTSQALTYINGATATANLNQSVYAMLKFTGASAATSVYIPPASKQYILYNNSGYTITVYNSTVIGNTTAAGTGTSIVTGDAITVWSDGTNVYGVKSSGVSGTLPIANGGTGQTTQQAAINALAGTQTANRVLRSDGTNTTLSQVALATDVSGTLPIANGGTGQVTANAAFNALAPAQTAATTTNKYLKSDGTNTSWDLFNLSSTTTVTAGSFVVGTSYTILSIGTTDFTLIGAASNTVGVVFTATGVGAGTGTAYVADYEGVLPVIAGGTGVTTAAAITALVGNLLFPVGAIYSAIVATNPGTLLGFGTWVAFGAGRVMVGYDSTNALFDSAEETGGSADAITVSHNHTATSTVTDPGHAHKTYNSGNIGNNGGGQSLTKQAAQDQSTTSVSTGITVSTSIGTTGSSGTNANYQPYITVYMWKRTA
jgi:hypothetical protein